MVRKSVDFGQKTVSKCKHLYSRSAIIYTIERENLLYEWNGVNKMTNEPKIMKIVYQDGEETKCKKGELVTEDAFTITIKTFKKEITIGKRFLVEKYELE